MWIQTLVLQSATTVPDKSLVTEMGVRHYSIDCGFEMVFFRLSILYYLSIKTHCAL